MARSSDVNGPQDTSATLVAALGVAAGALAPMTLTPAQFLALFLLGAFLGAFVVLLARSVAEVGDVTSPEGLLEALHNGVVGAVLAVALGVLTVGLGAPGWVFAVTVLAVAPFLRRLPVRQATSTPGMAGPEPARAAPAPVLWTPPLGRCSTSELAAAWTASHQLLEATSSPLMRARIAALRQEYIDELERRDRVGLQRWLASGAQASSDPGRFLTGRDDGGARPGLR